MNEDTGQAVRMALIEALQRSPLLCFLGEHAAGRREFRTMLETATVEQFEADAPILVEGQCGDRMYFLIDGEVSVYHEGKLVCTLARIGDVFGETGAVTGASRSASVTARTAVTCLVTDEQFMRRLHAEENPVFLYLLHQALSHVLAGRLKVTSDALSEALSEAADLQRRVENLRSVNSDLEEELHELRQQVRQGFHAAPGRKPGE